MLGRDLITNLYSSMLGIVIPFIFIILLVKDSYIDLYYLCFAILFVIDSYYLSEKVQRTKNIKWNSIEQLKRFWLSILTLVFVFFIGIHKNSLTDGNVVYNFKHFPYVMIAVFLMQRLYYKSIVKDFESCSKQKHFNCQLSINLARQSIVYFWVVTIYSISSFINQAYTKFFDITTKAKLETDEFVTKITFSSGETREKLLLILKEGFTENDLIGILWAIFTLSFILNHVLMNYTNLIVGVTSLSKRYKWLSKLISFGKAKKYYIVFVLIFFLLFLSSEFKMYFLIFCSFLWFLFDIMQGKGPYYEGIIQHHLYKKIKNPRTLKNILNNIEKN